MQKDSVSPPSRLASLDGALVQRELVCADFRVLQRVGIAAAQGSSGTAYTSYLWSVDMMSW